MNPRSQIPREGTGNKRRREDNKEDEPGKRLKVEMRGKPEESKEHPETKKEEEEAPTNNTREQAGARDKEEPTTTTTTSTTASKRDPKKVQQKVTNWLRRTETGLNLFGSTDIREINNM